MIFSSKYLAPAAAFAAVASVAISAPAQALSLTGGFDYNGFLTSFSADSASGDYTLDFNEAHPESAMVSSCTGSFLVSPACDDDDSYRVNIADKLVIDNNTLFSVGDPFLSGILVNGGGLVDFRVTSISNVAGFGSGSSGFVGFTLLGQFYDASGAFAGNGSFTANANSQNGSFSGSLQAVPTPAAVLPILAGLFGAASKRKRNGEEA